MLRHTVRSESPDVIYLVVPFFSLMYFDKHQHIVTVKMAEFIFNQFTRTNTYSVGKKPPTSILFVTEKMEQNSLKYCSRIIEFYIHVEDGFTSLPANFGAIRWKKRFFFTYFLGKIHIFRTMTASELKKKHLRARQKLYKNYSTSNIERSLFQKLQWF